MFFLLLGTRGGGYRFAEPAASAQQQKVPFYPDALYDVKALINWLDCPHLDQVLLKFLHRIKLAFMFQAFKWAHALGVERSVRTAPDFVEVMIACRRVQKMVMIEELSLIRHLEYSLGAG
jgi:hypothetical protein